MSNSNEKKYGRPVVFAVTSEVTPNESIDVRLISVDAKVIDVTVNERSFQFEMQHFDYAIDQHSVPRRLHCTVDGVSREFNIYRTADGRTHVLADGYSSRFEVRTGSKRPLVSSESKRTSSSSPLVFAPMPAIVSEILVNVGDYISIGTPLVRVEAMKMITTLNAPVDGVVRDIAVRKSQTVKAGEKLILLEPIPDIDTQY